MQYYEMVILYSPWPHRKYQNTQLQICTYHTIDNSLVCIATACTHYKWLNYSTMLMYLLCLWQQIGWHKITRYICLSIKIVHGVYYNYIINTPVNGFWNCNNVRQEYFTIQNMRCLLSGASAISMDHTMLYCDICMIRRCMLKFTLWH